MKLPHGCQIVTTYVPTDDGGQVVTDYAVIKGERHELRRVRLARPICHLTPPRADSSECALQDDARGGPISQGDTP